MKKFTTLFVAAMLALSMTACTPTVVKRTGEASTVEMSTGGASDKVPDPNVEQMDIISVYIVDEEAAGFLKQAMDGVDELTAQSLVDKLIEYGILEKDTKVLKYEADNGIGTLDLSKVPTDKVIGEKLLLSSIGNTFTENFELDKLKLLVNGENYSGKSMKQGDSDYLSYNDSIVKKSDPKSVYKK